MISSAYTSPHEMAKRSLHEACQNHYSIFFNILGCNDHKIRYRSVTSSYRHGYNMVTDYSGLDRQAMLAHFVPKGLACNSERIRSQADFSSMLSKSLRQHDTLKSAYPGFKAIDFQLIL